MPPGPVIDGAAQSGGAELSVNHRVPVGGDEQGRPDSRRPRSSTRAFSSVGPQARTRPRQFRSIRSTHQSSSLMLEELPSASGSLPSGAAATAVRQRERLAFGLGREPAWCPFGLHRGKTAQWCTRATGRRGGRPARRRHRRTPASKAAAFIPGPLNRHTWRPAETQMAPSGASAIASAPGRGSPIGIALVESARWG